MDIEKKQLSLGDTDLILLFLDDFISVMVVRADPNSREV